MDPMGKTNMACTVKFGIDILRGYESHHWFTLMRPAIKPLFPGGGSLDGGRQRRAIRINRFQ